MSIDVTIANVAIPSIRADLSASPSQMQWVIDIYTLMVASLLLLSGAMADRFGRRRIGGERPSTRRAYLSVASGSCSGCPAVR